MGWARPNLLVLPVRPPLSAQWWGPENIQGGRAGVTAEVKRAAFSLGSHTSGTCWQQCELPMEEAGQEG